MKSMKCLSPMDKISAGIVSRSLLLGVKYDHMGTPYQIPQTMAGVGIYVD
jgi:hypothetical protein